MDPIFTYPNQNDGVIQVEGYVDDTTTGQLQTSHQWIRTTLRSIQRWEKAGTRMDPHTGWQLALPLQAAIPTGQVLPLNSYHTSIFSRELLVVIPYIMSKINHY